MATRVSCARPASLLASPPAPLGNAGKRPAVQALVQRRALKRSPCSSTQLRRIRAPLRALHVPGASGVQHGPEDTSAVQRFDFVVIGSGIAGLSYALKVAEYGSVAVVTKEGVCEGCTQYAQGGVCAVLAEDDSVEEHIRDTVIAGGYLNDLKAVDIVCREGPARVLELVQFGAQFTRDDNGTLHLTREGGHSKRRIVHAADFTGREIERTLVEACEHHPNIRFFEHHLAVDLVTSPAHGVQHCFGVDVFDTVAGRMTRFLALTTMLASGGAGHVYPNTTNPSVATGDGIAMAYRADTTIANMEFVQFHPTGLYVPNKKTGRNFLISEAVRGEGGLLFNVAGKRFMEDYDSRLELAPRDVVARSIHDQLMSHGESHVLLDISHKPRNEVLAHFPSIAAECLRNGIDITRDPIPVVPVQHYLCGGVQTGLLGDTSVQGLFACGEVACSGLHGANRLASNSLLEGLVFAERAVGPGVAHAEYSAQNCAQQLQDAATEAQIAGLRPAHALTPSAASWVSSRRRELQDTMWQNCGIVRRTAELRAALDTIASMYVEVKAVYKNVGVSKELLELMNLVTVAELIVSCALNRRESRGLHYNADYPRANEYEATSTVITTSLKARYDLSPYQRRLSPSSGSSLPTTIKQRKQLARDFSLKSVQE